MFVNFYYTILLIIICYCSAYHIIIQNFEQNTLDVYIPQTNYNIPDYNSTDINEQNNKLNFIFCSLLLMKVFNYFNQV